MSDGVFEMIEEAQRRDEEKMKRILETRFFAEKKATKEPEYFNGFRIDKSIPIPTIARHSKWKSLLVRMEVGDSVLLENDAQRASLASAARAMKMSLSTRTEGERIRVWRTK